MYREWSASIGKASESVCVLYSSDYGYSDRLSQSIAKGITKSGSMNVFHFLVNWAKGLEWKW